MSNFSKVSLGVANKRYTHNLDFDNNTSANFGGCQPLFCQLLNQGDKLSGNIRQLVRLAPMPVPTFGSMLLGVPGGPDVVKETIEYLTGVPDVIVEEV